MTGPRQLDAAPAVVGALLTFAFAYEASVHGGLFSLGLLVAIALFLVAVYAFLAVPHIAVAVTIPFFALLPSLKVLVASRLGPSKDVIVLAAITAGIPMLVRRQRSERGPAADHWLVVSAALLLAIYVLNVGGRHGVAWAQGVRLVGEPLLLLLAGLGLAEPRRTLRWALRSLIATACFVAVVGLAQQGLGEWRLVGYGYSFGLQVRTYHGHLRSFGTLDEPFAYAAFLLLGLAAVLFSMRRGVGRTLCAAVLLLGTAASIVRTAAVIVLALLALELARARRVVAAIAFASAVVALAVALLVNAQGTESRTYQSSSTALTLNGRTSAWKTALGSPTQWLIGQGVGAVGTAATRARYTLTQTSTQALKGQTRAVDSGYFATVADVGVLGLAVLLALFGRAVVLARAATARTRSAGWVALGVLAVMLLDALTRASFTGFPSAFLGMLLLGIALAAADATPRPGGR